MIVYLIKYNTWLRNMSICSTFEKAKEDIIDYVNNNQLGELDWDLEDIKRDFEETTTELFGFDTWEEGLRLCDYDRIDEFLGDFASIEKITVDESLWKS